MFYDETAEDYNVKSTDDFYNYNGMDFDESWNAEVFDFMEPSPDMMNEWDED